MFEILDVVHIFDIHKGQNGVNKEHESEKHAEERMVLMYVYVIGHLKQGPTFYSPNQRM